MPYTLPPITVQENITSLITLPGDLGGIAYVKLVNASPYLIQLNNLLGGSDYLQPGEANVWQVPGLTTAIQATPLAFVSTTSSPSSVIVVTWYLEGETPNGNYPVNFNLLTFNAGDIGVASQTINDSNSVATTVIETRPINQTQTAFVLYNDGTCDWWVLRSDSVWQEVFKVINQAGVKTGQLLFPGGWFSGGTLSIQDDGLGNLTATGTLTAGAPVKLAAGNQETGMCGGTGQTAAVNLFIDMPINFKTVLTNTPTSISFTGLQTGNANAPSADTFHTYGCRMFWKAPSAGQTEWIGSYTTVGNCLLAVNAAARTFDFHCDPCGAVHPALPLSAARVMRGHDLSVVCPACGASEAFDTALSAADETDMTPQGSGAYATTRGAQARLVRQLMTALGLEVTP